MNDLIKLPYAFDLHFDIKDQEDLYSFLRGEPHRCSAPNWEVEELMEEFKIPFPDDITERYLKKGFPSMVWIKNDGTYITDPPVQMEEKEYQRMRIF